jgi:hypothetical protein
LKPNKHHGKKAREYHGRLFRQPIFPSREKIKEMLDNNLRMNREMAAWAKDHLAWMR